MVRGIRIGSIGRGGRGARRALALGVVGTLGCAAPQSPRVLGVQAVSSAADVRVRVEPEPGPTAPGGAAEARAAGAGPSGSGPSGSGPSGAAADRGLEPGLALALDRRTHPVPLVVPLTRLSRTELGSGWAIDLGRGEAGYDDQPRPLGLDPIGAGGTPEALIQLLWAAPVGDGARVVGRASTTRMQDQALSEVFRDPELSWVALGVELSF